MFTFLSVTRPNFEYNLRILANFGKFSRQNSKLYGFRPYDFKKLVFFFFNKDYIFYTKNLSIWPKNLLLYINRHTKSHIFLKTSTFCKKIITFSSSGHYMKKSTFLPKFHFFFFCTKLTFLHRN